MLYTYTLRPHGLPHLRRTLVQPGWELFKRPFTHYTDKFKLFLKYKFPKVIFLDRPLFEVLKPEVRVPFQVCYSMACWYTCD